MRRRWKALVAVACVAFGAVFLTGSPLRCNPFPEVVQIKLVVDPKIDGLIEVVPSADIAFPSSTVTVEQQGSSVKVPSRIMDGETLYNVYEVTDSKGTNIPLEGPEGTRAFRGMINKDGKFYFAVSRKYAFNIR